MNQMSPSGVPDQLDVDMPCVACGYNLRGMVTDGTCPECAAPVVLSLADRPFVARPERDGPVDPDLTCVRCSSPLQGQTLHGHCLTCRSPVWFSLHGPWLRARDPKWLQRVRSGFTMWLWSLGMTIVISTAGGIVGAVWAATQAAAPPAGGTGAGGNVAVATGELEKLQWMFMFPALIPLILAVIAAYRITASEPGAAEGGERPGLRRAVRLLSLVPPLVTLGHAIVLLIDGPSKTLGVVSSLLSLASIAVLVGLYVLMLGFARRIPDPKLTRSTTIVMWGYGIVTAMGVVRGAIAAIWVDPETGWQPSGNLSSSMALGGMGCVFGVAGLVFFIWHIRLLFRFRKAFGKACEQVIQDTGAIEAA
ncbi:MAG: hypothetical protein ACE5EX_09440 [Phycisphaerae bacterium]